jgi:nucleoside-diphosphate-sugar epimerase
MRILVTGASGHVGGAVAARLAEAGHGVVGLSRRPLGPPGLAEAVAADIGDADALEAMAAREPCEAVVHAAAAMGGDLLAAEIARVNCVGTQNVLRLANAWGARHWVFISSVPVIGPPRELPVTEDHPLDPPTAYHASKLFGERLTGLARGRGMAAAALRLTSPVGPGMPPGRIFETFVRRARAGEPLEVAGEGTRAQDYVDVRDVADAVLGCLDRQAVGTFNVAAGRAVTNADLARRCVAVLGSASDVRLGGRPDPEEGVRWEVSVDRAAAAFGYAPTRTLEDSILGVLGRPREEDEQVAPPARVEEVHGVHDAGHQPDG